ncbi:MAG: isoprenylcysteine carboxylmethyltransferase family protein [Pseudomonadota bacterium]
MPDWVKWIDLPPVWLSAALAVVWAQARFVGLGLGFGGWAEIVGGVLVTVGIVLILAAIWQMREQKTTPVPHRVPSALVTSGVFAWSRNPIYLGDVLILSGLILRWDALLSLVLVPCFVWLIGNRFIAAEESRCQDAFGSEFADYKSRTRRWI